MISYNLIKYKLYTFTKKLLFILLKYFYLLLIYIEKRAHNIYLCYIIPMLKKLENTIYQEACNTFDCHK